jgi:hypothetical protein
VFRIRFICFLSDSLAANGFNDAEVEDSPKSCGGKVLHNNRTPQKITKVSFSGADYRMGQRQAYQNPGRTILMTLSRW